MKKILLGILVLLLVALVPSVSAAEEYKCNAAFSEKLDILDVTFDPDASYEPGTSVGLEIEIENTDDTLDITIPVGGIILFLYDSDDKLLSDYAAGMTLVTTVITINAGETETIEATWNVDQLDYVAYENGGEHNFKLYMQASGLDDASTPVTHCDISSSYTVVLDNYPELDGITSKTATEDSTFTYTASASDDDNEEDEAPIDTLSFDLDATSKAKGMTIGGSTGIISWTPRNEHVGLNVVTVRVLDGVGGVDTRSFTINVANTNDAPSLPALANYAVQEDIAISNIVLDAATDVDIQVAGDVVSYSLMVIDAPEESTFAKGYIAEITGVVNSGWSGWDPVTRIISGWTPDKEDVGELKLRLTATDLAGLTNTVDFSINVYPKTMCEEGEKPNSQLSFTIEKPDDSDDFGPGDIITMEVNVENDAGDDKDYIVKAVLYDIETGKKIEEVESDDENIDEDEDYTFRLEMQIPLDADEDYKGDYVLYVKAYEDGNEEEQCRSDFIELNIGRESHEVIIQSIAISPSTVQAGDEFDVTVSVANIGKKDEEGVMVKLRNDELGIDLTSDAKDLGAYDESGNAYLFKFSGVKIPAGTDAKTYDLEAFVLFEGGSTSTSYLDSPIYKVSGDDLIVEAGGDVVDTTDDVTVTGDATDDVDDSEGFPWGTVLWIIGDIVLIVVAIFFIKLIFSARKRRPKVKEVKL